ncbi:MAG: HD domain-containing phosphohydrolase [Acidobacteriota bacterium]
MPPSPGVFRRVVLHGRPVAELLFHLPGERLEPRSFSLNWQLAGDEVGVVLYDASLHRALDGPPLSVVGTAADRIGVLLVGERPGDIDPFWSARLYFSLPEGASSEHLARAVRSLLRVLEDRARSAAARRELSDRTSEIRSLVDVGIALSAERDHESLLETILSSARALTAADAGSLYLVDEDQTPAVLRIVRAQNDAVRFDFVERALPLDRSSIAGFVAETGRSLNLPDVAAIPPDAPYRFDGGFDKQHGYRSRSMLAVPMTTPHGKTIGVLQLLNRMHRSIPEGSVTAFLKVEVVPFEESDEELAKALAAQAAVAVENRHLSESIRRLFEGFVQASVTAIEQRDPTTSGHSERVALLACGLAECVDAATAGPFADVRIGREELRELRYAAVLHDFGKVGVREQILVKARKLPAGLSALIRSRVEQAILSAAAEVWERAARDAWSNERVSQVLARRVALLEGAWELVSRADEPTLLTAEVSADVLALQAIRYRDAAGKSRPLVEADEMAYLSIPRGSLSAVERREIESHVSSTYQFLSRIPWTADLARVPEWAYAHHEKLDGSGYPRRLGASDLALPVRAITISDIYDALAARDRPYKGAVPSDRALEILRGEADRGTIDAALLDLFIDSKVYESALRARARD